MLEEGGEGRERTLPEQVTITIPLPTENDKERFPSGPYQEGIRSKLPHIKWLLTTFYLVPAGGTR